MVLVFTKKVRLTTKASQKVVGSGNKHLRSLFGSFEEKLLLKELIWLENGEVDHLSPVFARKVRLSRNSLQKLVERSE